MEPEGSLPCSQEPTTGPYPEPDVSSHTLPSCFLNTRSRIILPSTCRTPQWSHPLKFSHQNSVYISQLPLDLITLTKFGEAYKLRSSSLRGLLQPPATSSLLLNILLRTLFSNIVNLRSSFSVRYQVSYPP
jgi:hypothetical protein